MANHGTLMYVPPELVAEVARVQRQLGIGKADAIRIILKKRNRGGSDFLI